MALGNQAWVLVWAAHMLRRSCPDLRGPVSTCIHSRLAAPLFPLRVKCATQPLHKQQRMLKGL